MKCSSHAKIGLISLNSLILILILTIDFPYSEYIVPCNIGVIIGSYIPDIDSRASIANKFFNTTMRILLILTILLGLADTKLINVIDDSIYLLKRYGLNEEGLIFFVLAVILGKLSPHRMFTHKWLGTMIFIVSFSMIGFSKATLGFAVGYILHIIADAIGSKKTPLRFFEFKLPLRNSKNKLSIK